jgi:GR25 family glycosyltransferase involved in LPS biosynthesis
LRDVVRVRAVDGSSLDRDQLIKDGVIARELGYSAGTLGCAMSHIALWRMAADQDRAITIAEDDAVFSGQFAAQSTSLLAGLQGNWDIVLWSAIPHLFTWVDALPGGIGAKIQFFQGPLFDNLDKFQAADMAPVLLRLRHSFGTGCYSVSPSGARALLRYCLPLRPSLIDFPGFGVKINNEGIDSAMNLAYPSLNSFVCVPPMAVLDDRPERSLRRNM